jgi:hypothetical protein
MLVDRVLDAERAISAARTSAEADQLTRLREQWDSEIQEKIEGLYGLSAEERSVLASEIPSDEASDSAEATMVMASSGHSHDSSHLWPER